MRGDKINRIRQEGSSKDRLPCVKHVFYWTFLITLQIYHFFRKWKEREWFSLHTEDVIANELTDRG